MTTSLETAPETPGASAQKCPPRPVSDPGAVANPTAGGGDRISTAFQSNNRAPENSRRGGSAAKSVLNAIDHSSKRAVDRPERASFEEFLLVDARVPDSKRPGEYTGFTFEGREVIRTIVRRIDRVLSAGIADAKCGVAGGAQFGKTILELNLAAFASSQLFLRVGLFLPSDDLVQGVVDTKLRPDVIEQIPWLAEMTQVGKAVNKSGKAVNRKGAFMVTDGQKSSYAMVLGLQKIPTTFTVDIAAQDEVDDIPEKTAKFVKGRMTSSPLRFSIMIGTQRVAGRGQNKVWKDGSQGVVLLGPAITGRAWTTEPGDEIDHIPAGWINPEEEFPGIVRRQLGAEPSANDPKLTWAGVFERDGQTWKYERGVTYYLAHPETGAPLDRAHPLVYHRVPEALTAENWTIRISQLGIGAISITQIMQQFCEGELAAVNSPDAMIVFRCDVLGLPQSTAQAITPAIVERAQAVEPFDLRLTRRAPAYAGLDMGDQCWWMVREQESGARKRMIHAAKIPAADVVKRAVSLFHTIGCAALFIDQRPLVSQSRSIALELNGLAALTTWPQVPKAGNREAWIAFPSGLVWDGRNQRWRNLRCAVVRFTKNQLGAGVEHGFDQFDEGGFTKFVPVISCNRFETIDRVVRELLTPTESIVEVIDGAVRETPALLLPRTESDPIVATFAAHLITGSEREKGEDGTLGEYVDQCANHFLLADGYSALAEMECDDRRSAPQFAYAPVHRETSGRRFERGRITV